MHDHLDPSPLREDADQVGYDASFVRWPDPSPLQAWWAEIMHGLSPSRSTTKTSRVHRQAPQVPLRST
ncbi:hypothetical protein [Nocardia mangyaensis]|uniref:hypothetical protein n=1 Tax=Nocardia mangyaensis TaxID=2213200 RepID=UPI002675C82A|nr:hypothetical protein [Nocardia mangyaensis]MDO3646977.1 hypothetical protein [Nocardia mangyaensis]